MRFFLGALRVKIENLPFIDGDVLRSLSYILYGVDLSRACSNVDDFTNRNVVKLLKRGHRYHKTRTAFSKFYHRHSELIVKYGSAVAQW